VLKPGSRAAIFPLLLVSSALAGCASRLTEASLPDHDRAAVFAAAREVLGKRFPGFQVLDESQGLLITDHRSPVSPVANARFHARVQLTAQGRGTGLTVQVIQEGLAFRDMQMVWLDAGRTSGVEAVEGYIVEEIRARLEGRTPDIPGDPSGGAPAEPPAGNR
jgi:hypothetical protein